MEIKTVITPETQIRYLKGVGPKMGARLNQLGIYTAKDLVYYFPFRHNNYSLSTPINLAREGETVTVSGQISKVSNIYTRSRKIIQKATLEDQTGKIDVVWFNQPYLAKALAPGSTLSLSGKVGRFSGKLNLISPEHESEPKQAFAGVSPTKGYSHLHTGRLVPIYPSSQNISSKYLRKLVAQTLPQIISKLDDFLPKEIIIKNKLISEAEAVENIHFPKNEKSAQGAMDRLAFDEMLLHQLSLVRKRMAWKDERKSQKIKIFRKKVELLINTLPFHLTSAQKRVIKEILGDMEKETPMNRLLQGEVGSGKTIVATIAAYAAFLNKQKTAIMAPTEILASQHFQTVKSVLSPLGIKIILLTGGLTSSEKKKRIAKGDIIIGTHALIQKNLNIPRLGLVVIDEQHRFGVTQRAILAKSEKPTSLTPHFLTMTATPIPRTISLAIHGDLDISFLDEMPSGRVKGATFIVPSRKREVSYRWIKEEIQKNNVQAFIVCPFIEPSETLTSVKAAKEEFRKLSTDIFPEINLALLHGKLHSAEKTKILKKMAAGKIDILVTTPIVEVGIDIPNATIMVIEAAERFGLAQLHQLRGRIGRREKKGYCLLFSNSKSGSSLRRLRSLEKVYDGMKLAEIDLRQRGPGEVYGVRQHGFPEFKMASFFDRDLILKTRQAAMKILTYKKFSASRSLLLKKIPNDNQIAPN